MSSIACSKYTKLAPNIELRMTMFDDHLSMTFSIEREKKVNFIDICNYQFAEINKIWKEVNIQWIKILLNLWFNKSCPWLPNRHFLITFNCEFFTHKCIIWSLYWNITWNLRISRKIDSVMRWITLNTAKHSTGFKPAYFFVCESFSMHLRLFVLLIIKNESTHKSVFWALPHATYLSI